MDFDFFWINIKAAVSWPKPWQVISLTQCKTSHDWYFLHQLSSQHFCDFILTVHFLLKIHWSVLCATSIFSVVKYGGCLLSSTYLFNRALEFSLSPWGMCHLLTFLNGASRCTVFTMWLHVMQCMVLLLQFCPSVCPSVCLSFTRVFLNFFTLTFRALGTHCHDLGHDSRMTSGLK